MASSTSDHEKAPRPDVDHVEHEVASIQRNLGGLVHELDQRGHDLFDVRRQVRRHPVALALTAFACAALVAGGTALIVRHLRRQRSFSARLARFRLAVHRATAHPERVAGSESVRGKIVAAGGTAAASVVARRLAERLMKPAAT